MAATLQSVPTQRLEAIVRRVLTAPPSISFRDLAAELGISHHTIAAIRKGRRYTDIAPELERSSPRRPACTTCRFWTGVHRRHRAGTDPVAICDLGLNNTHGVGYAVNCGSYWEEGTDGL